MLDDSTLTNKDKFIPTINDGYGIVSYFIHNKKKKSFEFYGIQNAIEIGVLMRIEHLHHKDLNKEGIIIQEFKKYIP